MLLYLPEPATFELTPLTASHITLNHLILKRKKNEVLILLLMFASPVAQQVTLTLHRVNAIHYYFHYIDRTISTEI